MEKFLVVADGRTGVTQVLDPSTPPHNGFGPAGEIQPR
jgi:hypothetical protein